MARRREIDLPGTTAEDKNVKEAHFLSQAIDERVYSHFTFSFCTFEKIGAKKAKFIHCEFRHCEFLDCYLAHAVFEHCTFTGSHFDRCVFSWAQFPESSLDYTSFENCAPVLSQILAQKPKDPQAAAKFLRNLAIEHKKLGNWEQVDRFIIEAYRERERHFWYAFTGHNYHYKTRYGAGQRVEYMFRYFGYRLLGSVLGYGVSWALFLRTIVVFGFVLFPLLNSVVGRSANGKPFVLTEATGDETWRYLTDLYVATVRSFFSFVPSPSTARFEIPFWLTSVEAVFGTIMFAVFAALLFRWASKSN